MASRLKLKGRKSGRPPDHRRPDTMDYTDALKDPAWNNEIKWGNQIIDSNRRLGLHFFRCDSISSLHQ